MDKYVDTSKLPRRNAEIINWEKSVGFSCSFVYGDLSGEIEIVEYIKNSKTPKIRVKYNATEKVMNTSVFKRGNIGELLKLHTSDFRYAIGDILQQHNQNIKILDRWYTRKSDRNRKYYKYCCLQCGYENISTEAIISEHKGCPACAGKVLVHGINDIPTVAPWMVDYFPNGYEDAKNYTTGVETKIHWICPVCKKFVSKPTPVVQLYNSHSCGCKCDTYFSFPERVIYNLLEQNGIRFIHCYSKKDCGWAKRYRYDFYLLDYNTIVEAHGLQHYSKYGFGRIGGKSLDEEQQNDKAKRELALSNGVYQYFEVDCRYSEISWILQSLDKCGLLSFLKIDRDTIDVNALCQNVLATKQEALQKSLQDNTNITLKDLGKTLNISGYTIRTILNISADLESSGD